VIKQAFSLIEIIFTLAIVSIILMVAVPKFQDTLNATNLNQIKTTIILIREGILRESNRLILKNDASKLDSLDIDNSNLFSKVLRVPIISSDKHKINSWSKVATNSYAVYINDTQKVIFTFDPTKQSFDCDYDEDNCKELSQ
jgi:prepilin-type N-terminal cleavage/methylation domain-containing protein